MSHITTFKIASFLVTATALGSLAGCASYEVNNRHGDVPGYLIRFEMQEADRAVESARSAGKETACPAEFKEALDAKNHAYDVFRACHTEEGVALAKQATAKANALCPPRAAVPPPAPTPAPTPAPVIAAPAVVPPPPPVPFSSLSVAPDSIVKGQSATLTWTSQNSTNCDIQPGIGASQPQGSMSVAPAENTTYTLTCNGEGGAVKSAASVAVVAPAPVHKLCQPARVEIDFDTNKSDIKPKYHEELKKMADFLKENPKATGTILGYTDNVGGAAYNMKLSHRRAEAVREYLIKKFDIAPGRIAAKGYGEANPIGDNKTVAGRALNRRIESNFKCD